MTDPNTQKLTANRLCYTDGRDLACDGAAGLLLTSGTLSITNISATRISAMESVGIGVNTPNEPLEVAGTSRAIFGDGQGSSRKGLLIAGYQSGTTYSRIESYDYGVATGIPLIINPFGHGNVGINTFSPTTTLEVLGTVSATALTVNGVAITGSIRMVSQTAPTTCNSSNSGSLRYNSPTTTLELCTGSGWVPMGVGVPAGTIAAFASTTCPTGWSEYTAARGRFLRGIDNGAGNDPDGTRSAGAAQGDMVRNHSHSVQTYDVDNPTFVFSFNDHSGDAIASTDNAAVGGEWKVSRYYTDSSGGAETRPKNVAVTFCVFNGTSNGWNNPLSGGSTLAAGSTGYIQYNTGNAFDANAALTWTNASSRLTATNISATALTVNGVPITGSSSGDRIVSTSANVVAGNGGTISFTTGGVSGTAYFGTSGVLVGPGVSATGTVSAASIYTTNISATGIISTANLYSAGSVQVGGNGTEGCSGSADAGKMRRHPVTGRIQVCR
jgi:hypothetical protein